MKALFLTADAIGTPTGGGIVTHNESRALVELGRWRSPAEHGTGDVDLWSFPEAPRPWGADDAAHAQLEASSAHYDLAHCYSGTFSRTVALLRTRGTTVTYTAAAHSIDVSKREHEALGIPFDYPHLTDVEQWGRYIAGYRQANVVICPSHNSADLMRGYGCRNVVMIPHGVVPPAQTVPMPTRFSVAYLGQAGPDKGLRHLIEAWKLCNYQDVLLTIAGRGTEQLVPLVRSCRKGSIYLRGEVERAGDVYDACTLYVQPSASEGFGIEVLEAMTHERPVVCSRGAGAWTYANVAVPACNSSRLAGAIMGARAHFESDRASYAVNALVLGREIATTYTWEKIRERYWTLWADLI